jgi:stalled ribosome rescue protein Dom34
MSTFHAIVWLDRSEAHVIMFDREHIAAQKIKSRSHHKATGGHTGSHQGSGRGDSASGHHSAAGGHSTSDENFYHSIAEALKGVHEILVTGPAQAKDEFKAHCARHDKDIEKAIVGVISSDHPSDGQLVSMAKQYFVKHDRMQGQA